MLQVVNNTFKVKLMWELILDNFVLDKCTLGFSVHYSVYDEMSSYKYEFDITNFMVMNWIFLHRFNIMNSLH